MFSLQAMSACRKTSPVTNTCLATIAVALLACVVSDLSGTSLLDEGQEEFIVLAILIPLSFIYAQWSKGKSIGEKKSKCLDFSNSPRLEKPKWSSKSNNGKVASVQSSCDENSSREEYALLVEKLEICAKSGDMNGAEALTNKALERGLENSRLAVCFGHLLQACAHAKDAKRAKESFERMRSASVKPNVVHYGTLISVHAQTGDVAGAEVCLKDCIEEGVQPNTVCYNTILYACSRAGNMAKLKEWFGRMADAKVARDNITFSTIIHGAIRAKDAASLDTWLRQMTSESFSLQPRSYEDGLAICADASCSHIAEALFQEIVKNGVPLTSKMVQNIARARLYAGNWASCMEIIENAFNDGLDLLKDSFLTAAEASNKLGDSSSSAIWLARAEKHLAHSIDHFSIIASCALCAGKPDRAGTWTQKIRERGSAEQVGAAYCMLLKCCARLNDDASACAFADEAMKNDIYVTTDGYSAIVKACCRASNLDAAEHWLKKMCQAGMGEDPSAFYNIISLCTRLEDAPRGEFWIKRMAASGLQNDACVRIFLDMCEKSVSRGAKLSASRVIGKLSAGDIQFTSVENSLCLLKALIRYGQVAKAESVLEAFTPKFGKQVAAQGHQVIINAYAQEGNFRAAEAWLARMTHAGLPADVIAYSTIIHACARAGDPLRAEQVLERMQLAQVEPNTICFNEIINAFAEAGDVQKAEQYFEAIKQRNLTPSTSTYNSILKACARSGDVARAEVWFHKMVSAGLGVELDATTFGTLMNVSKDTDPMKTEQWLQEARRYGVKLNVVHISTAIHAHAKVGACSKAEALLEQALADGLELNTMCYNNVISACAEASQPDRAEGWLRKMRQAGVAPNSYTCYTVVNAWLKVSNFARAETVILAMEQDGLQAREEVFTAFAKTVARSGSRADLEACVSLASQRGCQDNEFFLHAHLSALVKVRANPSEVEDVVRTAVRSGVKLNSYIRNVLNRAFPYQKVEALVQECGGIAEVASRSGTRRPVQNNRNRA